jgi:hypothetical protein
MKRAWIAAFIPALLIYALAGTLSVNLVAANPIVLPLVVTLLSPENKTYTQQTIQATFTHHAPEQVYSDPISEMKTYYRYILDGETSGVYLADFDGAAYQTQPINVTVGTHTLQINAFANAGGPESGTWKLVSYGGFSQTVTFIIDASSPDVDPFLLIVVVVIVAVTIGTFVPTGLLFYLKKRKRLTQRELAGSFQD